MDRFDYTDGDFCMDMGGGMMMDTQGHVEQLSFFTRLSGEVSDAYSDLSQLYLLLGRGFE